MLRRGVAAPLFCAYKFLNGFTHSAYLLKIILSCIGKMKKGPQQELLQMYLDRLKTSTFHSVKISEFDTKPSLPTDQRKDHEAGLLLSPFDSADTLIALDETGRDLSSAQFATKIQDLRSGGTKTLGIIIGGADGLSRLVLDRSNLKMCLGRMTWPHMTVRALIIEQLYRADAILAGHPYHRE